MRECVSTFTITYEIPLAILARLADRQGRDVSKRDRYFMVTYGEGYSLDGTDRVAAVARIAGAAKYLMTIHGITRVAHTRETLDHRSAARSAVSSATVSNLCPDMPPMSTSGRRTIRPCRSKVSRSPEERVTRLRSTRHDDQAATTTRPSLNGRPHERHRR